MPIYCNFNSTIIQSMGNHPSHLNKLL